MEGTISVDGASDASGMNMTIEAQKHSEPWARSSLTEIALLRVIDTLDLNDKLNLPPDLHSFSKYSPTTCNVPGTVLGA